MLTEIDGVQIQFTHLDKVYWPEDNYTKGDLVAYYGAVAPYILPHLRDRPLVVTRYPKGIKGSSFYQKNLPMGAPSWVQTHFLQGTNYIICGDRPTLVWLGNQGAIELHPWFSRLPNLDQPTSLVFDLDPSGQTGFREAVEVAFILREALRPLVFHPKTSGATGLHLYLPLGGAYTYGEVREAVKKIAFEVAAKNPSLITLERNTKGRGSKVYLDYLQVGRGKTAVSPYSPRPLRGAPVAAPVTWEELAKLEDPQVFNIKTILPRLAQMGDLLREVY